MQSMHHMGRQLQAVQPGSPAGAGSQRRSSLTLAGTAMQPMQGSSSSTRGAAGGFSDTVSRNTSTNLSLTVLNTCVQISVESPTIDILTLSP